jgi:hypothetical protein
VPEPTTLKKRKKKLNLRIREKGLEIMHDGGI